MSAPTPALRLLLVGATGAVGHEVLAAALAEPRIGRVVAPTRRPLPPHPKLDNPVVDLGHVSADAPLWNVDAVICTLGTTLKAAGSPAAFAAVDRDLVVRVARLARAAGATRHALNSSLGASARGNLYLRTKAEAEDAVRALDYPVCTLVRPALIDTVRTESRPGEQLGLWVERVLRPLIPRRYRAVKPAWIARALLDGVLRERPGVEVIESEQLQPGP